ncbi:hypothetical protein ASPZODRAFT_69521 [Penicilliopsis zonata CBS 506.65]|uniref:PH domain-containing protein n=1 Tax=Penicilliopsis zonata CBS 506.65 TaxID=1073090 RepID=A0A1L9SE35_9EURO|nr:hypothetical protein ASPZODRAFT_69521 [Penicilliopsis zonata CBS 506.65]OJJ45441.1 hypothetical protein ASPZODRAFT_69521 [Penicilliopsis zonata CBS 506.65]
MSALPHRSSTLNSSLTRRTSTSDDEVIPDTDSSETSKLLLERLRAWKHLCGYLEDYVTTTAKVQRSQSKDYEKILKVGLNLTVSEPLKEGHHFSQSTEGVAGFFENVRANTQGMVNMYLETEKNLKGTVLPILERLHKEIKNKAKELSSGVLKGSKAVEKARGLTQKHIELLAQHSAAFDAAAGNRLEVSHDPYLLRRGINHRLNKQILEENNNNKDVVAVQDAFQQFEAHVLQVIQEALDQFFQQMGGQLDHQRTMYADILATVQRIPVEFEWANFVATNDSVLVNPAAPSRTLASITFPNQDHRATKPLIEGSLERKSRAIIKGYSSGYYVVTPARYLHEFKDDDDFRHDPSPELSLYLPDCIIGTVDGVRFNVKGKDVSGGKVGNAFHTSTELSFRASTPKTAEAWWTVIRDASKAAAATSPLSPVSPVSPISESIPPTPVATQPPAYPAEKADLSTTEAQDHAQDQPVEAGTVEIGTVETKEALAEAPKEAPKRSVSTASGHFHTSPGGTATNT